MRPAPDPIGGGGGPVAARFRRSTNERSGRGLGRDP